MTTVLQIEGIGANDLFARLDQMESAISALSANPKHTATPPQADYISRREVANIFKISLVTVNDWVNKGILQAYKVANRVYFKRSEVENALVRKGGKYE